MIIRQCHGQVSEASSGAHGIVCNAAHDMLILVLGIRLILAASTRLILKN